MTNVKLNHRKVKKVTTSGPNPRRHRGTDKFSPGVALHSTSQNECCCCSALSAQLAMSLVWLCVCSRERKREREGTVGWFSGVRIPVIETESGVRDSSRPPPNQDFPAIHLPTPPTSAGAPGRSSPNGAARSARWSSPKNGRWGKGIQKSKGKGENETKTKKNQHKSMNFGSQQAPPDVIGGSPPSVCF